MLVDFIVALQITNGSREFYFGKSFRPLLFYLKSNSRNTKVNNLTKNSNCRMFQAAIELTEQSDILYAHGPKKAYCDCLFFFQFILPEVRNFCYCFHCFIFYVILVDIFYVTFYLNF